MFTSRTLQAVHVRPPYLKISVEQAEGPSYKALTHPTERDLLLNPYLQDWQNGFDYVLVAGRMDLHAMGVPEQMLQPVTITEAATLYRIRR